MPSVTLPHGRTLDFGRPLVMGIVNVTPDSFFDGGRHNSSEAAQAHGTSLAAEGADILDVGGESTRPGHRPVEETEELARVIPVVSALTDSTGLPVSIDTMKSRVAAQAIAAGASIINDVWGFHHDADMARVAADTGALAIVMHNRAQEDAALDIVADVLDMLRRSIDIGLRAGMAASRLVVDPGFGFGKTHAQSLALIRELPRIRALGFPVLLGVSRKRAIGHATGRAAVADRLAGSLAAAVLGLERGADILRVHDVAAHVDAVRTRAAILATEARR